ncbi:hypothetical protein Tco_1579171, partial [Tanacetum coccineum]
TDKIRPGNGLGNVPIIRETFRRRIHGVSVPMAFPNGYESPIGVSVLQRAKGCSDIMSRHVGEVCAEKAILATELTELQLCLFTMSDERNMPLANLDEVLAVADPGF